MARRPKHYEEEDSRHRDLEARKISESQARDLLRQLCELARVSVPGLAFVSGNCMHSYEPGRKAISLDRNDLNPLAVVHELGHHLQASSEPHHGHSHRVYVDLLAALARFVL